MFYISLCIIACPYRLVKTKNIFLKNKRFKKPQPFPLFYPAIQYFTPFSNPTTTTGRLSQPSPVTPDLTTNYLRYIFIKNSTPRLLIILAL